MQNLLDHATENQCTGFERHLLMLAKGTYHQCPACFKPLTNSNLLRHFMTHLKEVPRRPPAYPFSRDESNPKESTSKGCCFVRGCSECWEPQLRQSYAYQLRCHLLTHTPQELRTYGINKVFLECDAAVMLGTSPPGLYAQLQSMDKDLVAILLDCLGETSRQTFQVMLEFVDRFLHLAS